MKEIDRLTGEEWRETIGHTINLELPMYVNRPLPNQPVVYEPSTNEYVVYSKFFPHPKNPEELTNNQ